MKTSKQSLSLTTVSVDTSIRDRINSEAVRLGLSQRQMVTRMVEAYDLSQNEDANKPNLQEAIEKMLKRDERIISFIREQEKVLLKPILSSVQSTEAKMAQLIELLKNLS